jgi:ACR3 family arsenite efflux pump ArsB
VSAALCKAPALALPLALFVLDLTLGATTPTRSASHDRSAPTTATAAAKNAVTASAAAASEDGSRGLAQLQAALGSVGRLSDLLLVMLALVWRASSANASRGGDDWCVWEESCA